jgi:hypothetical protein
MDRNRVVQKMPGKELEILGKALGDLDEVKSTSGNPQNNWLYAFLISGAKQNRSKDHCSLQTLVHKACDGSGACFFQ